MTDVHIEQGGPGDSPIAVLLHGSGASGVVWDGVRAALDVPFLAVDLPGHGRSGRLSHYSSAAMAAAVAEALPSDRPIVLIGHSLGGLLALLLADEIAGLDVAAVLVLSMKTRWSPEEMAARAARVTKPQRLFDDRGAALERFALLSGLRDAPEPVPDSRLASGIEAVNGGGYRLSQDPRTGAVPPVSPERIQCQVELIAAPVLFATGEADPMASASDLGRLGPVTVLPGGGHNVHVSKPDDVAALIGTAYRRAGW